jgi:hypothetical protein
MNHDEVLPTYIEVRLVAGILPGGSPPNGAA